MGNQGSYVSVFVISSLRGFSYLYFYLSRDELLVLANRMGVELIVSLLCQDEFEASIPSPYSLPLGPD